MTRALPFLCLLAMAQMQMPDPREISGRPLPVGNLAVGTVSVRVVRGSFANNLPGLDVEFTIDGRKQTKKTDDTGRAILTGLTVGASVLASVVVDGRRLESQPFTVPPTSGIQLVLAGDDPDAGRRAAEDRALATAAAVKGVVVLGPESRVVAQLSEDTLHIFYVVEILNTARTPVDIGGPVILDLPHNARGGSVEGTPQATVSGRRVTVTGPFAPGSTTVQVAYELRYSGDTARIDQPMPVALQQVNVIVARSGAMDVRSPQIASKRLVNDRGQNLVVGSGPAIPAGQTLVVEITGLPHYVRWPRYLALTLAGMIMSMGIWAAIFNKPRRRGA